MESSVQPSVNGPNVRPDSGGMRNGAVLADHIGLARPRRPERILAVGIALTLGVAVLGVAMHFAWRGELRAGTPRWCYFTYVVALLLVGAITAPWPRISVLVLSLATVELGLGLGSRAMQRLDLSVGSLLPESEWADTRFTWHPLLQAVPIPTPAGETVAIRHNSRRLRGPERMAGELAGKRIVAVFGGSTTYDQANVDGETWPERLEASLGSHRYAVINHGMGGYSSVEHVVQSAFYESAFGAAPHCAIYYMGWNDVRNAHIANLDPGHADYHLPSQIDAEQARRIGNQHYSISPALWIIVRLAVLAFDTVSPPNWTLGPFRSDPDPALEDIYARNIDTISAINRQRGIRTIWIGQILNRDLLQRVKPSPWIQFVHPRDLWPLVQRLNDIMRARAQALGDVYVDVPVHVFEPGDFVDEGHFNAAGSRKFSALASSVVAQACP